MKYSEVDNILSRAKNKDQNSLCEFSNLIDSVVNFGTHLIKWEVEKELDDKENIVHILFLKNILELADGISILVKKSSIEPSKILLRSMLENFFQLEYLLEKDTENRAQCFIVWKLLKDVKFYEKLNLNTQEGKQFRAAFNNDKFIKNYNITSRFDYLEGKATIDKLLKIPKHIPIIEEYRRAKLKNKNLKWFSLHDGPKNIAELATVLKHNNSYEIFYREFSENVHAVNNYGMKSYLNGDVTALKVQIRSAKDAKSIPLHTVNFLLLSLFCFCNKILPEKKLEVFDWHKEFTLLYPEVLR
jgi:hypothetical protein